MKFVSGLLIAIVGCSLGWIASQLAMSHLDPAPTGKPTIQYGDFSDVSIKFDHEYVLFTSSTCDFCMKQKIYLESLGVSFKEIALDKDKQASIYFSEQLKENGVPALYSKDKKLIGYNKNSINDFLAVK